MRPLAHPHKRPQTKKIAPGFWGKDEHKEATEEIRPVSYNRTACTLFRITVVGDRRVQRSMTHRPIRIAGLTCAMCIFMGSKNAD